MVKFANLFFLIFSTSPMPIFLHTNSSSSSSSSNNNYSISRGSMDRASNANTSPNPSVVLFKPKFLPIKTESSSLSSTKPNPPPIKSRPMIFIEPLPVLAGMGPALPLMDIEANPTLAIIILVFFLLLGLLLILLLLVRYVLPKNLVTCVSQCNLCYYSRMAAYQEI